MVQHDNQWIDKEWNMYFHSFFHWHEEHEQNAKNAFSLEKKTKSLIVQIILLHSIETDRIFFVGNHKRRNKKDK